jgi:hypothetical protein
MTIEIFRKGVPHQCYFDDADFDLIRQYKWNINYYGYARGYKRGGPKGGIFMHRLILGLSPNDPLMGDHKNGNKLDNRRENLRRATPQNNARNSSAAGKSVFLGVGLYVGKPSKKTGLYPKPRPFAAIVVDYKQEHLGYYDTEEEAALAYDFRARQLFGEWANLNFPDMVLNARSLTSKEKGTTIKLTHEKATEIRRRGIGPNKETAVALAKEFGVTPTSIGYVLSGKQWRQQL